jgi:hypothetical protein
MSRILRRPMFRGGQVIDSRGTGITSGLYAAGGAVETPKRGIVDGPGSYSYRNLMLGDTLGADLLNLDSSMGQGTQFDIGNAKQFLGTSRNILDQRKEVPVGSEGDVILKTTEDIFTEQKEKEDADKAKAKEMGVTVEEMKAIERENLRSGSVKDQVLEKDILTQPDLSKSTGEVKTEISAKDLIRENAELFKELLNEGNKEKIKEARIQDLSDLGLDIFAQSQKEGATVGSALAGAAERLVGKDSRVDKAKAAIEKGDQTAVALAINDYIAGKRSKESTDQLIAKLTLGAKLKEGSISDQILAVAARQTLTGGKIKEVLGAAVGDGEAKGIRTIPTGQENNYTPGPEDEGFFIFEEATKNVFKFENGVLKPIFRPG